MHLENSYHSALLRAGMTEAARVKSMLEVKSRVVYRHGSHLTSLYQMNLLTEMQKIN